jgi:hypothetical protein
LGFADLGFDYWNLTLDVASETSRKFFFGEKAVEFYPEIFAEGRTFPETGKQKIRSLFAYLFL